MLDTLPSETTSTTLSPEKHSGNKSLNYFLLVLIACIREVPENAFISSTDSGWSWKHLLEVDDLLYTL